jgi:tRNA pseudouridine38-40 synthase
MSRYFLELGYKGTNYSGFQVQQNANSIQAEVEKAFQIVQKATVTLTGSSRTDTGVHALQNYFHFDFGGELTERVLYKMNAVLPDDIVLRRVVGMPAGAHCRFDAISREYRYDIYQRKDPFLKDRAFYFPYAVALEKMQAASALLFNYEDFTSFSKRNTQVKSFVCRIAEARWEWEGERLFFYVRGDRFLRGMVRALVATMLKVGRGQMEVKEFGEIIEGRDAAKASFGVPGRGLYLLKVNYPEGYFPEP